ncbi:MAG: bifunctional DedA family/phosphatase PAP2 family protein [Gammaproteobacteria bacterium]|nr:MAG: bifunctional DedA family/phosphatase PAP2 family protein [Gammaproteobacteria bacterium]
MTEALQNLLAWVQLHPQWISMAVFTTAMLESLAVIGILVPGVVIMFGFGALVGIGTLDFRVVMAWSVAGAVVGDGVSFWLGYHYRDRLRDMRLFRRHAGLLDRGERFFRRHGGKSIVLGRLVGPIRAIVPVVAGMLGMQPAAFYLANLLSALIWAPLYLLPGIAFGTALGLAGEVAARLTLLLVMMLVALWFLAWLIRASYRLLHVRARRTAEAVLNWGRAHPLFGKSISALLDPARPEPRALLIMAVVLIGASWIFLGILEDVVTGDPLVRVDRGVYQMLRGLRTPAADQVMTFFTELGDAAVILPLTISVILWLAWKRRWRTIAYWLAAVGFGVLVTMMLKQVLGLPRPVGLYAGGVFAYSFPSGHATMSMVVYGFIAVLGAQGVAPGRRWIVYATAGLLIGMIAFSRLYLGVHWLSDVLGGLSLGLAWVSLLAIAYQRHVVVEAPGAGLGVIALSTLVLAGGWHVAREHDRDVLRYTPQYTVQRIAGHKWWEQEWRQLPVYRMDLEGEDEQPLNLQWAGNLVQLSDYLAARGWYRPAPLSMVSLLSWLRPSPRLADLPILPQVHDGRHEALIMTYPLAAPDRNEPQAGAERQLVVRLWPAEVVLEPGDIPLWVGTVSWQSRVALPLVSFPVTANEFDTSLQMLNRFLDGLHRRRVRRPPEKITAVTRWRGEVLLLRANHIMKKTSE